MSASRKLLGRRKKKSMSDIVEEQLGYGTTEHHEGDDWDDMGVDNPKIDDYYEGSDHEDEDGDGDGMISAARKKRKMDHLLQGKRQQTQREQKRLRRRGPLDASLSSGDYAAKPVDVEAAMDDIFGALEMNDEDEDGVNFVTSRKSGGGGAAHDNDDSESNDASSFENRASLGKSRGKKRERVGGRPETEEEYMEWLEAQQAKRRARRARTAGGDEDDILAQLESLRNAQMEVFSKEGGEGVGGGDDIHKKQRERAQAAVKHYVMVYSQLLRVRIKLQPLVARAVAFPQYYALPDYLHADGIEVRPSVKEVSDYLNDVLGIFYSLATDNTQKKKPEGSSLTFKDINTSHRRMMKDVDACIEYWGAKLVQPNSVKLRTVSQPLLQQIHSVLKSKTRLRAKVQKNRSHVTILGHPEHYGASQSAEGKAARALHIAEGDIDEEIYDDAEFLREVVKRGGVAKLEQQLQELQQSLRMHDVPEKRGFHRLTKGKAVNYEPRPKLVGFLLPVPYSLSGQHEVMVNSLFQ